MKKFTYNSHQINFLMVTKSLLQLSEITVDKHQRFVYNKSHQNSMNFKYTIKILCT